LQSEKDGIDRPKHHPIDKSKTLDQFAKDISRATGNMASLHKLIPMVDSLSELGRKLEREGKITVENGADYSQLALDFFLKENS